MERITKGFIPSCNNHNVGFSSFWPAEIWSLFLSGRASICQDKFCKGMSVPPPPSSARLALPSSAAPPRPRKAKGSEASPPPPPGRVASPPPRPGPGNAAPCGVPPAALRAGASLLLRAPQPPSAPRQPRREERVTQRFLRMTSPRALPGRCGSKSALFGRLGSDPRSCRPCPLSPRNGAFGEAASPGWMRARLCRLPCKASSGGRQRLLPGTARKEALLPGRPPWLQVARLLCSRRLRPAPL